MHDVTPLPPASVRPAAAADDPSAHAPAQPATGPTLTLPTPTLERLRALLAKDYRRFERRPIKQALDILAHLLPPSA